MVHAVTHNDRLYEFRSHNESGKDAATSRIDSLKMLVKTLI